MSVATANFFSLRSDLIVVERPSQPVWDGGRQVGTNPGRLHQFRDHQCRVEGQKSIDFMRERSKAPDGPEMWELDGSSDIPGTVQVLAELATADIDRVREIYRHEQDTANRHEITAVCEQIFARAGVSDRAPGGKKRAEVVTG